MFHLAALSNKDPEAKVNNVAYLPRINDELSELDLAPVIALLITRKGWTSDRAAQAERLYRMFLRLHRGYPGQRHALPADADEVWHAHILMTAQYRRDYLAVLGRFLDHDPQTNISDAQRAESERMYRDEFGVYVVCDAHSY